VVSDPVSSCSHAEPATHENAGCIDRCRRERTCWTGQPDQDPDLVQRQLGLSLPPASERPAGSLISRRSIEDPSQPHSAQDDERLQSPMTCLSTSPIRNSTSRGASPGSPDRRRRDARVGAADAAVRSITTARLVARRGATLAVRKLGFDCEHSAEHKRYVPVRRPRRGAGVPPASCMVRDGERLSVLSLREPRVA
jgi:hypothetical protein